MSLSQCFSIIEYFLDPNLSSVLFNENNAPKVLIDFVNNLSTKITERWAKQLAYRLCINFEKGSEALYGDKLVDYLFDYGLHGFAWAQSESGSVLFREVQSKIDANGLHALEYVEQINLGVIDEVIELFNKLDKEKLLFVNKNRVQDYFTLGFVDPKYKERTLALHSYSNPPANLLKFVQSFAKKVDSNWAMKISYALCVNFDRGIEALSGYKLVEELSCCEDNLNDWFINNKDSKLFRVVEKECAMNCNYSIDQFIEDVRNEILRRMILGFDKLNKDKW